VEFFNRFKIQKREETYESEGFIIGIVSNKIYHVPKSIENTTIRFPEGITGITEEAIIELRTLNPEILIVPGSFKRFNVELLNFKGLTHICLEEGVEEIKCTFGQQEKAIDIKLPSTIKKIGRNNYPLDCDLTLPTGVIEIENSFAAHDTNLISISIPGTVKTIPKGAFNQCKNLEKVTLEEGVETSLLDAFRGTNNLHTLILPSTYNGTINLPMESRSLTNLRGNSVYDGKNFEEEKNTYLKIRITRGNKTFQFKIKRGEQPTIDIKQNIIRICGVQERITIDCEQLQPGTYTIENGTLKTSETTSLKNTTFEETQITPHEPKDTKINDKLDIIFQEAYRDNIMTREDFIKLPTETKMQIKKAMQASFLQIVNQYGSVNADFDTFYYLYTRALTELNLDVDIGEPERPEKKM